MQVNKENPAKVFRAFKKGFEVTETYWTCRQMYLSNIEQGHNDSAAAFMTRVEDLVSQCQWTEAEREGRHIDLYYHGTEHFDIRCYIQNESAREGNSLMWDKVVDKAKCQECVGKEYARYRKEKVPVAHHLMVVHPLLQTPCPEGSRSLSQDHRDSLEAVGEDTTASNATDVASTMDAMVRKALVQHGARNAAFARDPTTTKQHAGVVPRRQ